MSALSVWRAIDDFVTGFEGVRMAKPKDQPHVVVSRINQTLGLIGNESESLAAATAVSTMWTDISGLHRFNTISGVDSRVRHFVAMFASWSPFAWLEDLISKKVALLPDLQFKPSDQKTWIDRLVCDMYDVTSGSRGNGDKEFDPTLYLANSTAGTFRHAHGKYTRAPEVIMKKTRANCLGCLKKWLYFPLDSRSELQYMIMECLIKRSPSNAFFLLTEVWELFSNPIPHFGRGRRLNSFTLSDVDEQLSVVLDPLSLFKEGSSELSILDTLACLFDRWSDKDGPVHQLQTSKSRVPIGSHTSRAVTPIRILPNPMMSQDRQEISCGIFLQFLQPILRAMHKSRNADGTTQVTINTGNSTNPILLRIRDNPDYYLPFREYAPTRQRVKATIFSNKEHLLTKEGFWSAVCHRGVFYGSVFARNHDSHFLSYDDWVAFKAHSTQGDDFFVNKRAYGPRAISQRSLVRIKEYWDVRDEWTSKFKDTPRTFQAVYNFLLSSRPNPNFNKSLRANCCKRSGRRITRKANKKAKTKEHSDEGESEVDEEELEVDEEEPDSGEDPDIDKRKTLSLYHGVGPLIALLICGDLALAGVIESPTKQQMGEEIASLAKGAKCGLERLNLVDASSSKADIANAFVTLYDYLDEHLTADEKELMGFSLWMLEHALCKYARLIPKKKK